MTGREGKAESTVAVSDKLWMINDEGDGGIYVKVFSHRLLHYMSADQSLSVGGIWCSNSQHDLWFICYSCSGGGRCVQHVCVCFTVILDKIGSFSFSL